MAAYWRTLQGFRLFQNHVVGFEVGVKCCSKRTYRPKWVAATMRELKRRKDIENTKAGGEKVFHRSTFLEWNYDAEIFALSNRLGENFNTELLKTALTHKSYIEAEATKLSMVGVQTNLSMPNNEKLAVRGEELISKYVKGYLRAVFNKAPEEFVDALHAYLTSTLVLSDVARHIGIGDLMLCSDFPCQSDTYATSFKAIVAALEKSSGEEQARKFVQDFVITQLYGKDLNEIWNPTDPIGILSSILKREGRSVPEFRLIRQAGSSTILAVYHVGVYSDKSYLAEGVGETVPGAQEMAARNALKRMFGTEDSMRALPFGRQLKTLQAKIISLESLPNSTIDQWTSNEEANI